MHLVSTCWIKPELQVNPTMFQKLGFLIATERPIEGIERFHAKLGDGPHGRVVPMEEDLGWLLPIVTGDEAKLLL